MRLFVTQTKSLTKRLFLAAFAASVLTTYVDHFGVGLPETGPSASTSASASPR